MESDNLPEEENVTVDLLFRKDRGVTDYELVKTFWIQDVKDFDEPPQASGSPLRPLELLASEKSCEDSEEERLPEELLNEPLDDDVFEEQGDQDAADVKSSKESEPVIPDYVEPSETAETPQVIKMDPESDGKDVVENINDLEEVKYKANVEDLHDSPQDVIPQNLVAALGGTTLSASETDTDVPMNEKEDEPQMAAASNDAENVDVVEVEPTFSDPYSQNLAAALGTPDDAVDPEDVLVELLFREPTDTSYELVYTIPLMEDVTVSDDQDPSQEEEQADFTFTSPGDNDEETFTLTTEVITVLENPNMRSDDTFDDEEEEAFQNAFVKSVETPCAEEENQDIFQARQEADDVEKVLKDAAVKLGELEESQDGDVKSADVVSSSGNDELVELSEHGDDKEKTQASHVPQKVQDTINEPVDPEPVGFSEDAAPLGDTVKTFEADKMTVEFTEKFPGAEEEVSGEAMKEASSASVVSLSEAIDAPSEVPREEQEQDTLQEIVKTLPDDVPSQELIETSEKEFENSLAPESLAPSEALVLSQYDNVIEESENHDGNVAPPSNVEDKVEEPDEIAAVHEDTVEEYQNSEVAESSDKFQPPAEETVIDPNTCEDFPSDIPRIDDSHVAKFVAMADDEHPMDNARNPSPDGEDEHVKRSVEPTAGSYAKDLREPTDDEEVVKKLVELAEQPLPAREQESDGSETKEHFPHQTSLDAIVEKMVAIVEEEHLVDREEFRAEASDNQHPMEVPVTSEEFTRDSEQLEPSEETKEAGVEKSSEDSQKVSDEVTADQANLNASEQVPAGLKEVGESEEVGSDQKELKENDNFQASEERRPSSVLFIVGGSSESAADLTRTVSEDQAIREELPAPAALEDVTVAPEEIPRAEAVTPEEVPSIPNLTLQVAPDDLVPGGSVAFIVGDSTEDAPERVPLIENYVTNLVEDIVKTAMEGVNNKDVKLKVVVAPENNIEVSNANFDVPNDDALPTDAPEGTEVLPEGLQSSITEVMSDNTAAAAASEALTSLEDAVSERIEEPEVVAYLEALQTRADVSEVSETPRSVQQQSESESVPEAVETIDGKEDAPKEDPSPESILENPSQEKSYVESSQDEINTYQENQKNESWNESQSEHKKEQQETESVTGNVSEPPGILASIAEAVVNAVSEIQEEIQKSEDAPDDIFDAVPVVGIPDEGSVKPSFEEDPIVHAVESAINDVEVEAPDVMKVVEPEVVPATSDDTSNIVQTAEEASDAKEEREVLGGIGDNSRGDGSPTSCVEQQASTPEVVTGNVTGIEEQALFTTADNFGALPEDIDSPEADQKKLEEALNNIPSESDQIIATADNVGAVPEEDVTPEKSQDGVTESEDASKVNKISESVAEDTEIVSSSLAIPAEINETVSEVTTEQLEQPGYDADVSTAPEENVPEDVISPTILKNLENDTGSSETTVDALATPLLLAGLGATVAEVVTSVDSDYDADVSAAPNPLSEDDYNSVEEPTSPIVVVNVDDSAKRVREAPTLPEVIITTPAASEIHCSTPPPNDIPEPFVETSDVPDSPVKNPSSFAPLPEGVIAPEAPLKPGGPHRITDLHFEIPKEHEDYGNDYVVFGSEKAPDARRAPEEQEEEDIVTELHFQPIRQWRDEDVISLQSLKSLVAEVGCTTETEVVEAVLETDNQLTSEKVSKDISIEKEDDHLPEETLKILKVVPSEPSLLELDFSDPNVIEVPIPLLEPATTYLEQMVEWIIGEAIKEVCSSSSKEVVTESEIDDMVSVPEPLMDMKFPHEDEEKTPEPEEQAPEEVQDREKTPEAPPRASKVRFGPLNIKLPRTYSEEHKVFEEMLERPLKVITTSPLARPPDQKAPDDEDGALSPLSPGTLAEYEHIPTMEMQSVPHSPNERVEETEKSTKETRILSPARSSEDVDEASECLDSIGDLSERTIQRFNTSIDDPSVRRDSFSSISSFGDRQKFRTAIENIRQDLLPFQSSVSQYLEPSQLLVANLSMDSPSDLSPNAPPATGFEAFEKSLEHPSAEGSIDSSGFEKVDHEGLEDFAAPVEDPMQQSVFGSLQAEDDDRKTPEDGFVFIERNEPSGTSKKMSSHHDDVIEKNYEAQTAALLESPIAEEARKLVQDAVESASEIKKQAFDDEDEIGRELLDNVKDKAHNLQENFQEHVVDPVSDTLHRAYDGLGDFVEKVKEPVHENVVEPVHDAYNKVTDFVETVKENAPKQVDEFTREHRPEPDFLPEVQENIHDTVDKVHDEVDNFLRGARTPSPPHEEIDEFQEDQKPQFGNQTPEEDETTFDRNGPLTIPEEVVKKVDDLADFDPLVSASVGQQFGEAIGSELTEEEMFGHQKFEKVPRPPTPPKDISDEDVKPSIVDLGPAHHHSHPGSPHHSILKHHGDAWLDFKTVPPCVLDVIYWRDAKKSAIVLALALLALFVLAKYPLLTVVTYSLLAALGAAAGFRIFKKVEAQIKKTDAEHPFQEILAKDISLPQEKVHAQADVLVEHATCLVNKLKSLVFVESPFESLKFGLVLWSLTYIASWFSGFTLAILGLLGVFSVPKVYEANQEAIDPHLATVQGHLKNVQNLIDEKLPFLRSAPVAAEEKKDQ